MKILLKEDVDNLGYAGEVYDVANGYGRNYLIPQGMAVKATSSVMKQAEAWRKLAEARREEMRAEYEELSKRIVEVTLEFTARAGSTGKLYGSITTTQIADEMNTTLGTDIDRRKVGNEPLRELGEHKVLVRLSADHQPEVTVLVIPEGGLPIVAEEDFTIAEEDFTEVEEDVIEMTAEGDIVEIETTLTEIDEVMEIDGEVVEITEVEEVVEVSEVAELEEIVEEDQA